MGLGVLKHMFHHSSRQYAKTHKRNPFIFFGFVFHKPVVNAPAAAPYVSKRMLVPGFFINLKRHVLEQILGDEALGIQTVLVFINVRKTCGRLQDSLQAKIKRGHLQQAVGCERKEAWQVICRLVRCHYLYQKLLPGIVCRVLWRKAEGTEKPVRDRIPVQLDLLHKRKCTAVK